MLVFLDANLTYLAVPKTGSTAVETALSHRADIAVRRDRKHMTAHRYRKRMAPFLKETFGARPETVAVMRAPIDQIGSWFRYRARDAAETGENSTQGLSFDDFVRAVIAPAAPPFAQCGSQFRFLTGGRGRVIVDHLFAWEDPERFRAFLGERLGEPIAFDQCNVSPRIAAVLSPDIEAALRRARATEFALHDRLMDAGGYLRFKSRRA